ncbi:MAG: hypothetical protein JXQ65_07045 [Candidatus Marinimicrobia bacterium]|nr:hypothetical protein [Candidatus Neomarinimicrobiota bacterium]
MKYKWIIWINLIAINLLAETTMLVLPFCASNVNPAQVGLLDKKVEEVLFSKNIYIPAMSSQTKIMIMDRMGFDHCKYFVGKSTEDTFFQVIENIRIDEVLSCAINFDDGQYGLFFKLRNSNHGTLIKSGAYGYTGDFQNLLNRDLKKILMNFLDLKKSRSGFMELALSGGYLNNYDDGVLGGRIGIGSQKWGLFSLETNFYTGNFAENISISYTTPRKYLFFFKLGVGFTSERQKEFTLTKYHHAPAAATISKMEHSAGALGAVGLSLPLMNSLRWNISFESDIIYSRWIYSDGQEEEGLIYNFYPEMEFSWQIKF